MDNLEMGGESFLFYFKVISHYSTVQNVHPEKIYITKVIED